MIDIRKYTEDDEVFAEAVRIRRAIHAHPEIGMECEKTTDLICKELDAIGVPYQRCDKVGVIADIRGTKGNSDATVMPLFRKIWTNACLRE